MSNTYSIAHLAAVAYLNSKGLKTEGAYKFVCDEGAADIVTKSDDVTVLVIVTAKRQRGEAKPPEFNARRLQHIAMCYLVQHPEVDALRFDVIEALIGTGATVSVNALEGAYSWER